MGPCVGTWVHAFGTWVHAHLHLVGVPVPGDGEHEDEIAARPGLGRRNHLDYGWTRMRTKSLGYALTLGMVYSCPGWPMPVNVVP
jgi:hypothetical protein